MPKPKAKTKFKKNDKLIVKEIDYDIDNEKLSESIPEKKESIDILALKAALASFEKTIGISLVQMRQGVSSMEKFNKELNDLTKLVLEFESNSKERDSALSTRIELLEHDIKDVKEDGKKDIEDIKKIIADYFKSFNENICPKELRQRCLKKAENKKTYFKWFGKIL
ncbi:MAG: hypothetical protein JXB50_16850, partial [Spirochaetes bacterium]|nr:hypothetical protein [Spirochaetota bacterium]